MVVGGGGGGDGDGGADMEFFINLPRLLISGKKSFCKNNLIFTYDL